MKCPLLIPLFILSFSFIYTPNYGQNNDLLLPVTCPSDTTSCDGQNLVNCRGPRSMTTCSTYLSFDPSTAINVLDSGAIGDGVFDNTAKLRELAALGKVLYFPPNNVFLVHGAIPLIKGIYGSGTIKFTNVTCFLVQADSVFVREVTIESTLNTGTNAPFAVSVTNVNHFELSNCRLINTRVEHESDAEAHVFGCSILNNEFITDFSPFQPNTIQNDIITLRGIDSAWVCHNRIQFTNVHRVVKIAESLGSPYPNLEASAQISPWNARNIWVRDNIITGTTTSNKQVMDLFDGTELFTLEHNYIDVRGFSSIIENKTGFTTDFIQHTLIQNNVLKNDNIIFSFQGSHGALNPGHDSGFQNVTIHNNCLEGLAPFLNNNRGLAEIRFFHEVNFTNNELSFQQSADRFTLSFLSNLRLKMKRNIIADGGLKLSLATTNHEAEVYRDSIRQIEVDSNQFINGFHGAIGNSIWAQSIGDDAGYLSIYGNHFAYDATDKLNALIQLNSLNFDSVNVSCNTVTPNFTELNGINYLPPANSIFIETTNTWNTVNCKTPTSNIYYVTPDALTIGTGDRTCPWVLDTAVAKANAGDIVYVLAGDYGAKTLTFPNSGTADAPIYFIGCTNFPSPSEAGLTDITIASPLSSFKDFLDNEIENTNGNVMPLLNGSYMANRAMNISFRKYLHIKNFSITNYVEAGIQGENDLKSIHLKNIIVSNIGSNIPNGATVECGDGTNPDDETNEPLCGFGIELYGDSCVIESCIVTNSGAHNISIWYGTSNHILDCKSYGNSKATNTTGYYIFVNRGDHNTIENCYVEREDGLTHRGHGIGTTNGSFNQFLNCTVKNSREGFYTRGAAHYNTFKNCNTIEEYEDGRHGIFPAVHIRDGASYNQFINCHFKNASIGVRILGSNFFESFNGEQVGIGTGHHNLFYNCLFDRPRTHISLREYLTNDCLQLKDCEASIGCDATLNPCLTCGDELSQNGCLNCMDLQNCVDSLINDADYIEGGNLFINCIFLGEATVNDNLIITNQRNTIATDTNRIINSIIYDISSFRACTNGTSLNNLTATSPTIFFPDATDCKHTVDCCPDFISKAEVTPHYFKIEHSLFQKNNFSIPHFFPNFVSDKNLTGEPEFIDTNGNYQLACNSPAINAGTDPSHLLIATFGDSLAANVPLFDFDQISRPLEGFYDMGIYELSSGSPDGIVTTESPLNSFYRNKGTIESNGTVLSGQSTKMFSEESITLKPDFHAQAGSNFLAKIEDCVMSTTPSIPRQEAAITTSVITPSENLIFKIAPNPFSSATQISIKVPRTEKIHQLQLFDNTGQLHQQLITNSDKATTYFEVLLNRDHLEGGLYFLSLQTNQGIYTRRIVVLE